MSKAMGGWFLACYANNPNIEIKLSDMEMNEISAHRIMVT